MTVSAKEGVSVLVATMPVSLVVSVGPTTLFSWVAQGEVDSTRTRGIYKFLNGAT